MNNRAMIRATMCGWIVMAALGAAWTVMAAPAAGAASPAGTEATELRFTGRYTTTALGQPNTIHFFGIPDDSFQRDQDGYSQG